MARSFRSGLVKVLNRLMSLVGDVCVNELRDAIAGLGLGLGLGLVKVCFVVGFVFGFLFCFVLFCF